MAQVMLDREADTPVGGPGRRVEMDDAYLGGKRRGGKRGRGAAAKTPLVVMLETNVEGHPLRLKLRAVKGFRKAAIKQLGAGTLAPGTRVVSGGLGWQGRFRWIMRPGNDFYFVYYHNWQENRLFDRFETIDRVIASKIVYTHQF